MTKLGPSHWVEVLVERTGGRRIACLLDSHRPSADAMVVVRMDRLGPDATGFSADRGP
jgi:hypothetical protein